ncbi:cobalt-precorrin 5A hydrolase [Sedimentibacter sp. zth1]|uniref:cobalt-precorrin 5A hydrolase n=1 Tax=Sedimentibacter sp. zth1 TaxID=2816908 RepID=UPI001A921355|nr:cobalt-precorrin 5A hydrolase [Sedimentibacter sp. zth1]QSX05353.1 cobalt-precorrin 5A hydrolase [Sedimentibacter sp. zth1]
MKTCIFAYSNKGCQLAKKIANYFDDVACYTTTKLATDYEFIGERSICTKVGEVFDEAEALIFIGACGIAVRAIAPFLKNKSVDPAVIVIDDCGINVISLLSGHIGGANDLTLKIAKGINATPIITTATDINNKFSVDAWAVKNNLQIGSMRIAKDISARILDEDVPFKTDIKIQGNLPSGLTYKDNGELGIYVSYKTDKLFDSTLHIIPKSLCVGIGCRRNISVEKINSLFHTTLQQYNINLRAIKSISSIDLKSDEKGLLQFADKYDIPINFYNSEELNLLDGEFTPSDFVKSITGVDNVCERAAFKSSGCGKFIVKKIAHDGVTIAICIENQEVNF